MQPSSYQYQPVHLQRNNFNKAPNFLNNKLLDKSAPTIIPNKQYNSSNNNNNGGGGYNNNNQQNQ